MEARVCKAQAMLKRYSTTIAWVDGGLAVVANVPGFGGACGSLRALLGSVEKVGELAQHVLDTIEAVLEAVEHLRRIKRAVVRASAEVKAQLDRDMTKVKKIIDDIKDTIENVPKSFIKAAMKAAKTAKKLHRLAGKLEKALKSIERTLQLETFRMALEGISESVRDLTAMMEGKGKRKGKGKKHKRMKGRVVPLKPLGHGAEEEKHKRMKGRVVPLKPLGHGAEEEKIVKQHRAAVWAHEYHVCAPLAVLPSIGGKR
jgi:uncharacterized protein YukE